MKIRVGVVGIGPLWESRHMPALRALSDRFEVAADADEQTCRELALASEKARRALDGREIAKVIVRPPRLVNLVTSR